MKLARLSVLMIGISFLLTACGSSFTFVRRPEPSSIKGAKKVAVVAMTYEGLMIGKKSFDQYIKEKEDKAAEKGKESKADEKWDTNMDKWQKDMTAAISSELKNAGVDVVEVPNLSAATEGVIIQVNVEFIEPGFYTYVINNPSQTRVRVKVIDATKPGDPIYEFLGVSSHGGYTTGGRIGMDISSLANQIAKFLRGEISAA